MRISTEQRKDRLDQPEYGQQPIDYSRYEARARRLRSVRWWKLLGLRKG